MKWIVIAAGLAFAPAAAQAEIVSSGPNGFHVRQTMQLVVPQEVAFAAFGRVRAGMDVADKINAAPLEGDKPEKPVRLKRAIVAPCPAAPPTTTPQTTAAP